MWTAVLGPVANLAGQWLANRQEKSVAKQKLAVAKIEAQVKKVEQDGDWEEIAMKASDQSWKDEAWTVAFIAIVIGSFIPPLQPYMAEGFANLERAPQWFQWAMYASIAASFGIRTMRGFKK